MCSPGLAKTHVGELLTNPIYAGRLRTGEPAGIAPIVEPALWSKVQSMRELRRTRTPGRIVKRNYQLRLRCSGCQRFLYGDVGRYRHPPQPARRSSPRTPTVRRRYTTGHDKRVQGHSYPQEWYEHAIGKLLEQVGGVDDVSITEAVPSTTTVRPGSMRSRWLESAESAKMPVATSPRAGTWRFGSGRWRSSMPRSGRLANQSK